MAFDVRVSGEHAKIVLSGDVDLQTTADLKNEIQTISDVARLEIEAGDVTYIDSSGVAVLLLARQHCAQNNIALSLPAVSDAVQRVLQIAKLDVMLPIGQVVTSTDAGMMGLGTPGVGVPTADDDLVNQLLAVDGDADASSDVDASVDLDAGVDVDASVDVDTNGAGGADDDALAAALMRDADDAASSGGDFGGLDIGAADFETPSAGDGAPDNDVGDPIIDGGAMKPGTFS